MSESLKIWEKVRKFFLDYKTNDLGIQWAIDVWIFEKQVVSNYVRKSCMRHLLFYYRFLNDKNFELTYNEKIVKFAYAFFQLQKIPETKKPYILIPFRAFMLSVILGWRYKKSPEKLLCYEVLDVEGRKNGKSIFWSIFALFVTLGFLNDGFPRTFISGPIKESSDIIYKMCGDLVKNNIYLEKEFKKNNQLYIKSNNDGQINKLAFDKANIEGQNPSLVILTEFHLHPDKRMQESARTARNTSRPAFLIVYDTTKGHNINYPFFELEKNFKLFLDDQINNPEVIDKNAHIFSFIAELDEDKYFEWDNPENWRMTNLGIGYTLDLEDLKNEFNSLSTKIDLLDFKIKRAGMWVNQSDGYFEIMDLINSQKENEKIYKEYFIETEKYKDLNCIIGLDLSNSQDTTAIVANWEIPTKDNKNVWIIKHLGFIPRKTAFEKERIDRVPYSDWEANKFLISTEGDIIDYSVVSNSIKEMTEKYRVALLAYDEWQYRFIKNDIVSKIYFSESQMVKVKQGVALTPSIKEFERKLKDKKIYIIDNNKMLINHLLNISMKPSKSANDNFYPEKVTSRSRIDGAIALFTSLFERPNVDCIGSDYSFDLINLN